MKATFLVLFAGLALVGAAGVAAADDPGVPADSSVAVDIASGSAVPLADQTVPPAWPGDDSTENNTTVVQPGQQLAGAVGAQGASVGTELWNRTLSDRLDNATSPGERAEVLAEEADTIEQYVDLLAAVRANVTGAWANGTISAGEYRTSLSAFVVRAHAVELRANRTVRAAESLPFVVRERHGLNVTRARNLSERARGLYQFEDEIGQEVVNETLTNESALSEVPVGVEVDDSNRSTTRP
ncbi:DUF7096 domain-containing protein [Halorussus litoreus]|uniref:DUF7096 domain-containing protein n=1 Tax=Halorussus litoreus TaxID=1710536 RepID=UPI000E2462B7|nr:hypothetical protein [Halorussus litoreus]